MALAYEFIDGAERQPGRTAFVLHGILGSRRNWRSMARRLAENHPTWRFVLIDLRGHGESKASSSPHTLEACVDDLVALSALLGEAPSVVIGHSFGGKVSLVYGRRVRSVQAIWSLDSPPDPAVLASNTSVLEVISAAREAPLPFAHRLSAVSYFESLGFARPVAGWMTTNLGRTEDGFRWRFELDTIEALLDDYQRESLWPYLEDPTRSAVIHFVLAERSTWWRGPTEDRLMGLDRSFVHTLETGHWVHIDDPVGLAELFRDNF